jgi:thioredoxin reductase
MFDVLIIGGGVSGISCALVLGSAKDKILQPIKSWRFHPSKSSSLQEAVLIMPTDSCRIIGSDLLVQSTKHLSQLYPNIAQISKEKILRIEGQSQTSR